MLRVMYPFFCNVNIPNFSFEIFFEELKTFFYKEQLFFNLPIEVEKNEISKSNENWVIFTVKVQNVDKELFYTLNTSKVDIVPGETFHFGFHLKEKTTIVNFSTNLRADQFRFVMYAVPSFTEAFFLPLKNTEYFIYESLIGQNVFSLYKSTKEKFPKEFPYRCYQYATENTPDATNSSLYFYNNEEELNARGIFFQIAYAHQFVYKTDMSPEKMLHYLEFFSPTNEKSRQYVADHIVNQLETNVDLISKRKKRTQWALYIGAAYGQNVEKIQKHYKGLQCFGVEPVKDCVEKYCGDNKRLFWMNAEELCNFKELHHQFDYIFVLNYNVLSNQQDFFDAVLQLMRSDGKLIVGQSFPDPYVTTSPVSYIEHIKNRFEHVELVKMPKYVFDPLVAQLCSLNPQYQLLLKDQASIYQSMANVIGKNLGEDPQTLVDSVEFYAHNFKQFLYCATRPRSKTILNKEQKVEVSLEKLETFSSYMEKVSCDSYEERIKKSSHPNRLEINQTALASFRSSKKDQEHQIETAAVLIQFAYRRHLKHKKSSHETVLNKGNIISNSF